MIDQDIIDLKYKVQTCEFYDFKHGVINLRSILLKEPDLTLKKANDICKANGATTIQIKSFASNRRCSN